jgi:hypothetical protein
VITPRLILDSKEQWRPVAVEYIVDAGAKINGQQVDLYGLPEKGGRIDFPRTMVQPIDSPLVGYHRVAEGGGLYWHQFWTWWLYNPKKYAGFGEHEGDWELVQIGCADEEGDHPILVTCSQHDGGEKREFWRVQPAPDTLTVSPLIYVARDSHANYFEPHQDVTDIADGSGPLLKEMEWRDFGPWANWKGKWGNSDNSPGGLAARRAWQAPHAYHGQARG